jgi:hypothetical protein
MDSRPFATRTSWVQSIEPHSSVDLSKRGRSRRFDTGQGHNTSRIGAAVSRTFGFRVAAALTRAVRTDEPRLAWHFASMTNHRKRKALDLFIEALVHPVRFR